jgi:hypothetical protein
MYRQSYLDPTHARTQFDFYPVPNFPAYAGYMEDVKALPTKWFDGLKAMEMDQVIGAVGMVMIGASYTIKGKKKLAKKLPITQKQALQVGGSLMTVYSLYQTYMS